MSELVHHGLVLLLLSLALWFCLSHLAWPLMIEGGAHDAGWLHMALAAIGVFTSGAAFFCHLRWWLSGQWRDRSGVAFRLLIYCMVAQGVAYLGFFPSFDRASFSTTLMAAAGTYSVLLLLSRLVTTWLSQRQLSQRQWPKRLVSTLDLAVFYLCVLMVGGEITLRVAASLKPSVLLARAADGPARNIAAWRSTAGQSRMGFPVNSSGFYDVDVKAGEHTKPLVVAIGDSFSMGVVPHHFHFTTVAERRHPGVEVYNMGIAAIGPPEYLHLLRTEAVGLDPDVIVINIFVGNDLTFSLPPADEALARRWYSRDNVLFYQLFRRLPLLFGSSRLNMPGESIDGLSDSFPNPSAENVERIENDFPWISDPMLEEPTFTTGDFLRTETSRAETLSSFPASEFHRRFQILREIVDAAGQVPVVFLLIPDEFQVEDRVWEEVQRQSSRPLMRNRGLDLLVEWLRQEGLRYANLLPLLKAQTPLDDGRLHLYHLRDTHFNARGNRVAGEALAELVRPLLPTAPAAEFLQTFPVYAGEDGDPWISDLQLFNPGISSTATSLKLTLLEGETLELPTLLQPGGLVVIDDLGRRSKLAGAGFVSVQSDSPVVAGVRAYQRRSTGTVGDFVSLAGGTPLAASATMVDQGSGDLAIFPGSPLASEGVLVGLAHGDQSVGDDHRTVHSKLSVHAPEGGELSLVFASYGAEYTARPDFQYTLSVGEILVLEDVVARLGYRDTEGALWFQASRPVLVVAHTSRAGAPGPSSQTVLASSVTRASSEAYFLFASRTGTTRVGTRSDLALANPGPSEVRIDVRLTGIPTAVIESRSVAIGPRRAVLLEDAVAWLGMDQLSNGVIAVRGDGPFAGVLNLIDLRSGDVTTKQAANP